MIGDDKYGEPSNPLGRLGLHAYELSFRNPLNGKEYQLRTPLPKAFKSMFFKTHQEEREERREQEKARTARQEGKRTPFRRRGK